jgi:hypothetical protein
MNEAGIDLWGWERITNQLAPMLFSKGRKVSR